MARQPISLAGLSKEQRDLVVVTGVADDNGVEHVLCRIGDRVWDLSPEVAKKNTSASHLKIFWPKDVPQDLVDDAKAVVYCALRQGRSERNFSASSALHAGRNCGKALRHFAALGALNFSHVRALHVADHIADLKCGLSTSAIMHRLVIVDLVWSFESEVQYPLPEHPFGGRSLFDAVGRLEDSAAPVGITAKTPVIPPSVQAKLWGHCEAVLANAEAVLQTRDSGRLEPTSDPLIWIRNAVLYMLQVTSGMRNSESTGMTAGCWRSEERTVPPGRQIRFHWVRTREVKTTGGKEVDFLVPPEAFSALEFLQRFASPLQLRLADEAEWLVGLLSDGERDDGLLGNGIRRADALQRLRHVREIGKHMLLGIATSGSDHLGLGSRVDVISAEACGNALKGLVAAAAVEWDINNHQCRRTFSYNVANSRLGRMGLVFVKWQLKHASISWTQLYAANPRQDQALYDEFAQELVAAKVDLLVAWNHVDARLSGGAGKKLMQTRAVGARNLKELLVATAQSVELRSTGHAWCMSGTRACNGQGVYDPTLCGGCSQAVIDQSQGPMWQMIHLDNLRLTAITDCGPAVQLKAKRAVETSVQVLADLGVPLPTEVQAKAYDQDRWDE